MAKQALNLAGGAPGSWSEAKYGESVRTKESPLVKGDIIGSISADKSIATV